jgi:2'-5' RNA ligase
VGRVLREGIVPLGGGIVAMPAGPVKGLAPILATENSDSGKLESDAGMYKYSSTQCTLSSDDASSFLEYVSAIDENHLYHAAEGEDKYGREDEPHVTILYGIKGNEAAPIELSTQGCGPIKVKLGAISAFVNDDKEYDVLKVDVESDDLRRLHALLRASTDNDYEWDNYHPHLTLAYLRKGLAAQYIDDQRFAGRELTFNSFSFQLHWYMSPSFGSIIIYLLCVNLFVKSIGTNAVTVNIPRITLLQYCSHFLFPP